MTQHCDDCSEDKHACQSQQSSAWPVGRDERERQSCDCNQSCSSEEKEDAETMEHSSERARCGEMEVLSWGHWGACAHPCAEDQPDEKEQKVHGMAINVFSVVQQSRSTV